MAIRIDPETMRTRAGEYRARGEEIDGIIANMDSMLQQLKEEWEGSASEAYENRYLSELKPNFQKAVQLTNEIASALDQTASNMEEQDRQIASGFQG